jgi:hypothetical protein
LEIFPLISVLVLVIDKFENEDEKGNEEDYFSR